MTIFRRSLKNASIVGIDSRVIAYDHDEHARRRPRPGLDVQLRIPEQRIPQDHPLRAIRALVDDVLREMSRECDGLYSISAGRRCRRSGCCAPSCCRSFIRFAVGGC